MQHQTGQPDPNAPLAPSRGEGSRLWPAGLPRVLVIAGLVWLALQQITPSEQALHLFSGAAITCVAVIAAAVANATAVGGGFIFMPFFIGLYALTAQDSLKLSLCTQAFGMTSGMLTWSRSLIDARILAWALLSGGAGVVGGTFLITPGAWIKPAFGWASIAIGLVCLTLVMAQARRLNTRDVARAALTRADLTGFALLCLISGAVTSWVSIGIGEVVALWMILKGRFDAATSVATGVAALALCSVLGAALHFRLGGVPLGFLTYTAPGVILGGFLGARLAKGLVQRDHDWRLSPQLVLKLTIAIVILVDGLVTLVVWRG